MVVVAQMSSAGSEMVWSKASASLRLELGEDVFGSWLAHAALRPKPDGGVCLVTPTGLARDWIRRNAWRRVEELWAANDPDRRVLSLKSRHEYEAEAGSAGERPVEIRALSAAASPVQAPAAAAPAVRLGAPSERFTFDSFVIGPANEFAHMVARKVAAWSDGHFNPVVIHGPYGFGKTHLLGAMAHAAQAAAPERKVVYLTAERFLSTFVRAVMDRQTAAFKDDLRSADLLLIDDVQFVGGKQASQDELFHTLAALMEEGRRVVFTADRPPSALTDLDARLRSHLSAGLVCGIEPADGPLRLAILQHKLKLLGRQQDLPAQALGPDILAFLAERFTDSVRELEGALNTLVARAGCKSSALSLDEAHSLLRPLRGGEKRLTVDEIQKVTAEHFGLKQADLLSERRTRSVARPRQAAMWLCKQLTTRSLPDIGRRFGGRDHTTVIHAVRRIEELKAGDPRLAGDLEALVRKLRG